MAARKPKALPVPDLPYVSHTITDLDELHEVIKVYEAWGSIVFDVETEATREPRPGRKGADKPALDERTNVVTWLALAGPGRVDVIPMGHPTGPPQLTRSDVLMALRPLFFDPERTKVNQNVKFDILSLAKYWGEIPPGPFVDTVTAAHMLTENLKQYDLGTLAERYLHFSYQKLAAGGVPMSDYPFEAVANYVGLDAKLTHLLWNKFGAALANKEKLLRVFQLENDITEVLIHAKARGVLVDKLALAQLAQQLEHELDQLERSIYKSVGHHFLITSTQQKAKVLYDELGLSVKKTTEKGAPSTSEDALKPLVRKHPVVQLLLHHAEKQKLLSTYAEGLAPFIEEDGRIRCSLNQNGTVTGRFSSSDPNLQNVPRQTEEDTNAARIRAMFIAGTGRALVVGDYSQIELRLLAHYAGPTVKHSRLLEAFNSNIDLHTMTASGLFGKAVEEVDKEERQRGKTANFLLSFGGGPNRLILSGGYTAKVADETFAAFHRTYPEIERWSRQVIEECRKMRYPYVETILGRRRRLPEIALPRTNWETGKLRAYAERQAVNAKIQGSAADICKMAMVRAFRRIERAGKQGKWFLLLQVHDEIILDVSEDETEAGIALLREAMEGVKVDLLVPLVADIHAGPNWAAAK